MSILKTRASLGALFPVFSVGKDSGLEFFGEYGQEGLGWRKDRLWCSVIK